MTLGTLLSFPKGAAPLAALSLTLALLTPTVEAQCFTPDGYMATNCCDPVTPNLPTLNGFSLESKGICWQACQLNNEVCIKLQVDTPALIDCSKYLSDITAFDCFTGDTLMKGTMTLDYTRTWTEFAVAAGGPQTQVWRYAAKVDMVAPVATSLACPVPNCAAVPGASAFYYGYVDYTLNCVTGLTENVVVLYHGCDRFAHDATFSGVPGAFHPDRSFAIVGPSTAANPFVPGISLPGPGGVVSQGMRRTQPTAAAICTATERIQQGFFQPEVSGCICPLGFQPPQQSGNRLDASGQCGGAFSTLNFFPTVPWYDLIVTSIGRWSNGSSYPGPEHASVAEGLFLYTDSCPTVAALSQSFDIMYGGLTQGGFPIDTSMAGAPPTSRFIDLASNYSNPVVLPISFPLFGNVAQTDHLIFINF